MSGPAAEGWKVGRRAHGCGACEAAFVPGAEVVSVLHEVGDDFDRRDLCRGCFEKERESRPPYSWWSAPLPEPEQRKAVLDQAVARDFLLRLLRENADERASLRYLLCLMLLRKRGVKLLEQFTDGRGDVMVVSVPPDEAQHEVVCVDIDEAESDSLREQLGRLFDLGDAPAA